MNFIFKTQIKSVLLLRKNLKIFEITSQFKKTYEHFVDVGLLWQRRIYATFTEDVEERLAGLKYSSSGATQFSKKTSQAAVSQL